MKTLLLIAISSALINNVVLSQFMGLCPFLGVSKKIKTASGMGAAVIFVITISSLLAAVIYQYVLVPLNLTYLNTIVFILVIAALVQFVEMVLKKVSPSLYRALGVYLPLITTNCAVLGVALTNVSKGYNILTSVVNGFATALGFAISIIILILVLLTERINGARSWFNIGGFSLQPGEIAKIAVILFVSNVISKMRIQSRQKNK